MTISMIISTGYGYCILLPWGLTLMPSVHQLLQKPVIIGDIFFNETSQSIIINNLKIISILKPLLRSADGWVLYHQYCSQTHTSGSHIWVGGCITWPCWESHSS